MITHYRLLFHRPTARWLNVVFGSGGPWGSADGQVSGPRHAQDIAEGWGLNVTDLDTYEGAGDPSAIVAAFNANTVPPLPPDAPVAAGILAPPAAPPSQQTIRRGLVTAALARSDWAEAARLLT